MNLYCDENDEVYNNFHLIATAFLMLDNMTKPFPMLSPNPKQLVINKVYGKMHAHTESLFDLLMTKCVSF